MTLPTSGPLSLNDIQTEFGGSNPISLSEYYAGGGLVPAGTSGTNGAVPSSGAISINNFYGTNKILDTQTITVGTTTSGGFGVYYGYTGTAGSISDGTFNPKGGATITEFDYWTLGGVRFALAGTQTNSGWTQVVLKNNSTSATLTLLRSAATFSTNTWSWSSATNIFGTTNGVTVTAVFT